MDWQPIKTAPYEIDILIYSENYNPEYQIAWWCFRDEEKIWQGHADDGEVIEDIEPTHWMPLPEPPK